MPLVEIAQPFRDNWYFDSISDGIERRLRVADDASRVHVVAERPGKAGRAVVADHFDAVLRDPGCIGAVAIGFEFEPAQVARLLEHGKPVIAIGGYSEGLPSITVDDERVARDATRHLIELGHEDVAHLAGYAISPDDFTMRTDRVRGYSEAMREAGLDERSHVVPCEFTHEAAYRAAKELLSDPARPTAVFAVADELAFAVLDAAHDLGLEVPRDVSVVGIDDHRDAAARGLTTWRQDPLVIGAATVDRLLGVTDADHLVLTCALVNRTTAGPPRPRPVAARPSLLRRLLHRG